MIHISKISQLRSKAKDNLNTLVGIGQMQYVIGFEAAIENVYLECNRLANIDREISQEYAAKVHEFCLNNLGDIDFTRCLPFDKGRYDAYKICRDVLQVTQEIAV